MPCQESVHLLVDRVKDLLVFVEILLRVKLDDHVKKESSLERTYLAVALKDI